MIRVSTAYGKNGVTDITYVANEAVALGAPTGSVGLRVGGSTTLTPQLQVRALRDCIEKLVELAGKQGLADYQQISGVATAGKSGLSINTLSAFAVTFQDAGDTVTKTAHGLVNDTPISFDTIVTTTGIVINTRYFVVGAAANTFQVALTVGGAAIALTTNGSGTVNTTNLANLLTTGETKVGAYSNLGAGLNNSSTKMLKLALGKCLEQFMQTNTAV